ncbi:hypothetical protein JOD15_003010 [Enterococcus ureilyticus]|nr:hypothetical protein [Enterococcus ureilyticus]
MTHKKSSYILSDQVNKKWGVLHLGIAPFFSSGETVEINERVQLLNFSSSKLSVSLILIIIP